jgi:hypothetical protein
MWKTRAKKTAKRKVQREVAKNSLIGEGVPAWGVGEPLATGTELSGCERHKGGIYVEESPFVKMRLRRPIRATRQGGRLGSMDMSQPSFSNREPAIDT